VLVALACLLSRPAAAQDTTEQLSSSDVKRQLSAWTFRWDDHPSLRFGELLTLDFRARLHGELRRSDALQDDDGIISGDRARRRVGVAGTIGSVAQFQVERELVDGGGWRDVYVNYRRLGPLELQAGKFKMPFGLDENTSPSNLDFVFRSRAATQLAPGRDRGIMAHGRVGMARYSWGVFANDGDNVRGLSNTRGTDGVTTAGRLVVQPFRSSTSVFESLQAGVAYTASDATASVVDLRGDTPVGPSFFRSEFAVKGARRRVGLETRWRPGPYGLQAEFTRLTSERLGQSISDTDLPPLIGAAWYVQGTWIATGERKTRGADSPRRPLLDGGIGSIELAARLESVSFRSGGGGQASTGPRAETIQPRRDRVATLGVNWWPNRWIRLQANLIRDTISTPSADGAPVATTYWSHVLRFGISL
jgi:phosphate-selective porin OprO/OprP